MTLPLDVVTKMRRLFYAEHWKVGTIAAQLGVHHDAVERALGLERCGGIRPDGLLATRVMASKLDPYKSFVDETLVKYPRLGAMRVFHMVRGARLRRRLHDSEALREAGATSGDE